MTDSVPPIQGVPKSYAIIIVFLVAAVSALGAMVTRGDAPLPVPPVPHPAPVDDHKVKPIPPAPKPDGETVPDVKPLPPTPAGPVAAITVQDSSGTPVSGDVQPGQQIVFGSERSIHGPDKASLVWNVDPPVQQYVSQDGSVLVVTMPIDGVTLKVQQIVAYEHKIATQTVLVKSNRAPQPPPVPPHDDTKPKPTPNPPKARKVSIVIVEDATNRPPSSATFLNFLAGWTAYQDAGNDYRLYHVSSTEAKAVEAKSTLTTSGQKIPGIIVKDKDSGECLYVGNMPTVQEAKDLVKKYTGDSL